MDLGKRKHRNILYAASIRTFSLGKAPFSASPQERCKLSKSETPVRKCSKMFESTRGLHSRRLEDWDPTISKKPSSAVPLPAAHWSRLSCIDSPKQWTQQTSTNINKPCGGSLDDSGCLWMIRDVWMILLTVQCCSVLFCASEQASHSASRLSLAQNGAFRCWQLKFSTIRRRKSMSLQRRHPIYSHANHQAGGCPQRYAMLTLLPQCYTGLIGSLLPKLGWAADMMRHNRPLSFTRSMLMSPKPTVDITSVQSHHTWKCRILISGQSL